MPSLLTTVIVHLLLARGVASGEVPTPPQNTTLATSGGVMPAVRRSRLVFLYYHKTGHNLVQVLKKTVREALLPDTRMLRRTSSKKHRKKSSSKKQSRKKLAKPQKRACCPHISCDPLPNGKALEILSWQAQELALLPAPLPPCYAVVHMVRDPARWCTYTQRAKQACNPFHHPWPF